MAVATGEEPPNPRYGVAFTMLGLEALHVEGLDQLAKNDADKPFAEGLAPRAVAELNDADPRQWLVGRPDEELHGVFIVTGATEHDVNTGIALHFAVSIGRGYHVLETLRGNVRPGGNEGHEHFGFLDGVSQTGIRGCIDPAQAVPLTPTHPDAEPTQGLPGQDLLWPGEFIFGYPAQDPLCGRLRRQGAAKAPPVPFMVNGAYLVVRRLRQHVPEMHGGVKAEAERVKLDSKLLEADFVRNVR